MNPFRHLRRASKPLFAARKGTVFSLALRGNLVAAGAGAATLEVNRVRQYPGGRWLDIDAREVELTVPLGADVAPSLVQLDGATLRTLKTPVAVSASTLKANATPEAIVGAPGELVLGRVSPRRKSSVGRRRSWANSHTWPAASRSSCPCSTSSRPSRLPSTTR